MAGEANNNGVNRHRTKAQKKYFFLDKDLYKILREDRTADLLKAWSYADQKTVSFVLSDIRRKSQQAFDTIEVCRFINRDKDTVVGLITRGLIHPPLKIFQEDHGVKARGWYKWTEKDVLELHDYYLTAKKTKPVPTRAEIVAMMRQNQMFYTMDQQGNYVPVFNEANWG